jgi:hypothetical protein
VVWRREGGEGRRRREGEGNGRGREKVREIPGRIVPGVKEGEGRGRWVWQGPQEGGWEGGEKSAKKEQGGEGREKGGRREGEGGRREGEGRETGGLTLFSGIFNQHPRRDNCPYLDIADFG